MTNTDVERMVGRERAVEHLVGDAPAPAELHGADVHLVHLRRDDRAVALLDQLAGDAAPAELGGERQTDRPAADDQNGNFYSSPKFAPIPDAQIVKKSK